MKLRDLLFGRPKPEAPAIWKRKRCKSCVFFNRFYLAETNTCVTGKRKHTEPLYMACNDWKGKK